MIPRAARRLCSLPFALAVAIAWTSHCASRVVDAVDMARSADGGPLFAWPRGPTGSNSDPWLVAHHDSIVEMRPSLMVLDFYNPWSMQLAEQRVQDRIDAIAESSRYHGYADSTAPKFLNYVPFKIIDLTDPQPAATWNYESSRLLPIDSRGLFDTAQLFTQAFATSGGASGRPAFGVPDPGNASRYLTLCELFELGIINELWLMTGDEGTTPSRRPPAMIESKQVYDAQGQPLSGVFDGTTGYEPWPSTAPHCAVTARIAYLSPITQVGCDLVSYSVGIENTATSSMRPIPYLSDNARDFFDSDFTTRYGTPFDSWEALVSMGSGGWCTAPQAAPCISHPSDTVAQGTYPAGSTYGSAWKIDPFRPGCGTAHFPPNAGFKWDYANLQPAPSRCEHYGMRDGAGATDILDHYSSAKEAAFAPKSGDGCAGGWQTYYRQSMPGLHNGAYATDGTHMKNWWPFLFY